MGIPLKILIAAAVVAAVAGIGFLLYRSETMRKAFAAGVMIGIGCTVYLSVENKVVGAVFFSIGLFAICSYGMYLFTGKIGYIIQSRNKPNCLTIWFGNLCGSAAVSVLLRIAKPKLHEAAAGLVSAKLSQNIFHSALLAVFCGILMFLAVDNFAKRPHTPSGIVGIFLGVTVFILCGFEHSIADMNYCIMAVDSLKDAAKSLDFLLVVSIFNGIGAIAFRSLLFLKEK